MNPLNDLRVVDLRQIEKSLELRREVLDSLLQKDSQQRAAVVALLPDGFNVDSQRDLIRGDMEHCIKILQFVRLCIREKH